MASKNWKVWALYSKEGNLLAIGRHKEVDNVSYQRFVYRRIYTDRLYRINFPLDVFETATHVTLRDKRDGFETVYVDMTVAVETFAFNSNLEIASYSFEPIELDYESDTF